VTTLLPLGEAGGEAVDILRASMARAPTVRLAAVIAPAALLLHELRYLIGFGDHAGAALASRGHAYLPLAAGVAGLLLTLGTAQLLVALGRAHRSAREEAPAGFAATWLTVAAALLAVYSAQELLEALLAPGHEPAAAALVAGGGWSALPLALAIGAAVALLLRFVQRAVALAAARGRRPLPRGAGRTVGRPAAPVLGAGPVLARHLAGRAPPLAFASD
jgi:hypothetical protein